MAHKEKHKLSRCPGCGGSANKNGWIHKKEAGGWTSCKYYGSKRIKSKKIMKRPQRTSITVHIPVTMLSNDWKGDFKKLPANKTYQLIIDYPLTNPAYYNIKTGKNGMGLIALLSKIGKLYEKTYEKEDASVIQDRDSCETKYGIFGHDIGDLNLSGININHKSKKIKLMVDS